MNTASATLSAICATTSRLPYGPKEFEWALTYMKMCFGNGRDLKISFRMNALGGFEAATQRGLFIFQSSSLGTEFLFTKLNSGVGLFGGQKASYASFVNTGDLMATADDWAVGTVFKSWGVAVTSIGNVFRAGETFGGPFRLDD